MTALGKLGVAREESKQIVREAFTDPDFDLHVFSEGTKQYGHQCFSPRSRRAADWVHEPCSASFAQTRCSEIMLWLKEASKQGLSVANWIVLDDDDLLQRGGGGSLAAGRQRTAPTGYSTV